MAQVRVIGFGIGPSHELCLLQEWQSPSVRASREVAVIDADGHDLRAAVLGNKLVCYVL